jgi:hypothetical protein
MKRLKNYASFYILLSVFFVLVLYYAKRLDFETDGEDGKEAKEVNENKIITG